MITSHIMKDHVTINLQHYQHYQKSQFTVIIPDYANLEHF